MRRRQFVKTAAGASGIGLLAGCTSDSEYHVHVEYKTPGIEAITYETSMLGLGDQLSVTLEQGIDPTPSAWALLVDGEQRNAGELDTGEYRFQEGVDLRGKGIRLIIVHGGELDVGFMNQLEGGDIIEEATFTIEEVTAVA